MKTCSICGKRITPTYELCNKCRKYKDTVWAKELIRMERRQYNLFERRKREIPFSLDGRDIFGEKQIMSKKR